MSVERVTVDEIEPGDRVNIGLAEPMPEYAVMVKSVGRRGGASRAVGVRGCANPYTISAQARVFRYTGNDTDDEEVTTA